MKNFTRQLIHTSIAVSALLSSPLVFADTGVRIVDTSLLKIEKPQAAGGVYSLYSTADGRVYSVTQDPSNIDLIATLNRMSKEEARKPIHLIVKAEGNEDEVIGLTEMGADDSSHYADPLQGMPSNVLFSELDGATENATTTASQKDDGDTQPAAPIAKPAAPVTAKPAAMAEANLYGYQPSILASMADAQTLFNEERNLAHDSQCHERALVWSHDMYTAHNVKSMKVMMFFTTQFQNTYLRITKGKLWGWNVKPYKWWYHTAPFVYVGNQEVVIDREFVPGAMTLDQWTHFFMSEFIHEWTSVLKEQAPRMKYDVDYRGVLVEKDEDHTPITWSHDGKEWNIPVVDRLSHEQTHCRVLTNYRELNQQKPGDWCMVRKIPMFYHQPESVQRLDCDENLDPAPGKPAERFKDGRLKFPCRHEVLRDFNQKAVDDAYANAAVREADPATGR
jgi:hypothetical protein